MRGKQLIDLCISARLSILNGRCTGHKYCKLEHKFTKVLNFTLLYAKYYIYLARCKKQTLTLNVFQKKLKVMYNIHKEIAFTHEEEDNFQQDWSPILLLVNDIVLLND